MKFGTEKNKKERNVREEGNEEIKEKEKKKRVFL